MFVGIPLRMLAGSRAALPPPPFFVKLCMQTAACVSRVSRAVVKRMDGCFWLAAGLVVLNNALARAYSSLAPRRQPHLEVKRATVSPRTCPECPTAQNQQSGLCVHASFDACSVCAGFRLPAYGSHVPDLRALRVCACSAHADALVTATCTSRVILSSTLTRGLGFGDHGGSGPWRLKGRHICTDAPGRGQAIP